MPSIELIKATRAHVEVLQQIDREIAQCKAQQSRARGANATRLNAQVWVWRAAKKGVKDIFERSEPPAPGGSDEA